MNSYLISTPVGYGAPDGVHAEVKTDKYNNGTENRDVWDCLNENLPVLGESYLIGSWDASTGNLLSEVHPDFYQLRPLGNNPAIPIYDEGGNQIGETRAGLGTDHLRYHYWATPGLQDRQLTMSGHRYPDDNAPFFVECRLLYNDIYGWYPRFEVQMEGADLPNDPSVRNFRIFSSADCIFPGEFLYTLAALQVGDSIWHTDANGDPLQVWFSVSNQFTAEKDAVHFALYWSEYEEGRYTLAEGAEGVRRFLWTRNQGDTEAQSVIKGVWSGNYYLIDLEENTVSIDLQPNGAFDTILPLGGFLLAEAIELDFRHMVWEVLRGAGRIFVEPRAANGWVETESVVSGQAGQLYYLSSSMVAGNLVVGEKIKLGTEEVEFRGIWPGFTNLIQIEPYIAGLIGEKVYVRP